MFCDIRDFTRLSQAMAPMRLQVMVNAIFERWSHVIQARRGTLDKYLGDGVMAFWGAPAPMADHAGQAVRAALDLVADARRITERHQARGLPPIRVGIGLNTGLMCVGEMGSRQLRNYTVMGDAVNLASRLERLSHLYGADIVAGERTRAQAPGFHWQALDRVQVRGRDEFVAIYEPRQETDGVPTALADELAAWAGFLRAARARDWRACEAFIASLQHLNPAKAIYPLYARRIASLRRRTAAAAGNDATDFVDP